MYIIIIGGGKMVYFLSKVFLSKGYTVVVINRDHEDCTQLARRLNATILYGDGSQPQMLADAGAHSADAVLAVTPNDQDNLVICQIADKTFHVPQVIASVNNPDNEIAFRQLGIKALATTRILANAIEQNTGFEEILHLTPLAEGKINVTEVQINDQAAIIGKSLLEIALPQDSLIAAIVQEGQALIPRGATIVQAHDRLVVMTTPENHGRVLKMLTGDER